jgi:hypothetical protein
MDPDLEPGGPKTSGSPTMIFDLFFSLGGADVAGGNECLALGAPRGRGAVAKGKSFLRSLGFSVQDRFSGQIFWLPVSGIRNYVCRI